MYSYAPNDWTTDEWLEWLYLWVACTLYTIQYIVYTLYVISKIILITFIVAVIIQSYFGTISYPELKLNYL